MKNTPFVSTSSIRGELISQTSFCGDNLIVVKNMIFGEYQSKIDTMCRIVSECYFTFLPKELYDNIKSENSVYTICNEPARIMDVYYENMKKRDIHPNSTEGTKYLLSLYKASAALVCLVSGIRFEKESLTTSIYSLYGLYLNDYLDDIDSYLPVYSTRCTENFSKGSGDDVFEYIFTEIVNTLFVNLSAILYSEGFDADILVTEVGDELKSIYDLVEEDKKIDSSINALTDDLSKYAFTDKEVSDEVTNRILKRMQELMVYHTSDTNECQ